MPQFSQKKQLHQKQCHSRIGSIMNIEGREAVFIDTGESLNIIRLCDDHAVVLDSDSMVRRVDFGTFKLLPEKKPDMPNPAQVQEWDEFGLPIIRDCDVPPMPKCKPPRQEPIKIIDGVYIEYGESVTLVRLRDDQVMIIDSDGIVNLADYGTFKLMPEGDAEECSADAGVQAANSAIKSLV